MTSFPLGLWDLSLWLAATAIILFVTAETSTHYGAGNLNINKKRLKNVALATAITFLITFIIRIVSILTSLSP